MTPAQLRLQQQLCRCVVNSNLRVPEAGILIWGWFSALSNGRSFHHAGPNPISYTDLDAFCRLQQVRMEPHHVRTIRAMDVAWLEFVLTRSKPDGTKPRTVSGDVAPEVFDALFQ